MFSQGLEPFAALEAVDRAPAERIGYAGRAQFKLGGKTPDFKGDAEAVRCASLFDPGLVEQAKQ